MTHEPVCSLLLLLSQYPSADAATLPRNHQMDLSANICVCCCMVHTKDNLSQLGTDQDTFLSSFLGRESVTSLPICRPCKGRLEDFKQFCDQIKENIRMLKMIKQEQTKEQNIVPDSTWNRNTPEDLTVTQGGASYINKMKENQTKDVIKQNPPQQDQGQARQPKGLLWNEIIIQERPESCRSELANEVIPDVSIVWNRGEELENDDLDLLEEPVSPPPSTYSFVDTLGGPFIVPAVQNSVDYKTTQHTCNSDERRKHRNREASRRYRERARGNPELLKKMRDQQNARQKKYYARLRMKKMNPGDYYNDHHKHSYAGENVVP